MHAPMKNRSDLYAFLHSSAARISGYLSLVEGEAGRRKVARCEIREADCLELRGRAVRFKRLRALGKELRAQDWMTRDTTRCEHHTEPGAYAFAASDLLVDYCSSTLPSLTTSSANGASKRVSTLRFLRL
jgi:hypothetical protein